MAATTSVLASAILQRQGVTTANGAPSLATTQPPAMAEQVGGRVNLFVKMDRGLIESDDYMRQLVDAAWKEDPRHTMIIILNARDRDGGKGEREVARKALLYLTQSGRGDSVRKNVQLLPTFGRWDDLLLLPGGVELMARQLLEDVLQSTIKQTKKVKKRRREDAKGDDDDVVLVDLTEPDVESTETDVKTVETKSAITLAAKWAPSIGKKLDKKHGLCPTMIRAIQAAYEADKERWAPILPLLTQFSANANGNLVFHERFYRHMLAYLREYMTVVERLMCQKRWDEINLNTVPSCAMHRLKKAFKEHLGDKYATWVASLKTGVNAETGEKVKVNAGQLFCHEVVSAARKAMGYKWGDDGKGSIVSDRELLNAQWRELERKLDETCEMQDVLAVADVSGSMDSTANPSEASKAGIVTCMDVALSLALLTAGRVKGPFRNTVMTFTSFPKLHQVVGDDLISKLENMRNFPVGYDTNLQAVFDTILSTATHHRIPASEMPKKVLILSDMQFNDHACGTASYCTNYEVLKKKFADAGYPMPDVIFWCISSAASRGTKEFPVTANEQGTTIVSGFSTNILKQVMAGDMTPWNVVRRVLEDERYKDVTA